MKSKVFLLAALSASLVGTTAAQAATVTVDFTGQTGRSPTRTFSSGGLTLVFEPSTNSPQPDVASSGVGLCLYANSEDGINRCGVTGTVTTPANYNFLKMTASTSALFTGGSIAQILGNSQPINIYSSLSGPSIGVISTTSTSVPPAVPFTLSTPILLQPNQPIFFGGAGINASTRIENFIFEVPSPSAILGASAAFGWSRRLRKRIAAKVSAE